MITCHPQSAKNTQDAFLSKDGTVLFPLRHPDITCRSLGCDCTEGFPRHCDPMLAAWVGHYPEQVMHAEVSYGLCPMCEIPRVVPMGHSTFRPLNFSTDQHINPTPLEETTINALDTLGVHLIHNQSWQYPLCNVYWLWQPDEVHQLLLGSVKNSLHRVLKHLNARNVKDQFNNRFASIPHYAGLQFFSTQFNSFKSGTWKGKEICVMMRTLV